MYTTKHMDITDTKSSLMLLISLVRIAYIKVGAATTTRDGILLDLYPTKVKALGGG